MELQPVQFQILFTQSLLAQHCGVSLTTVKTWCKLGIGKNSGPKRHQYFSHTELLLLAEFMFASKYLRVYQYDYLKSVLRYGGIYEYVKYTFRMTLEEFIDKFLTEQDKQGFWEQILLTELEYKKS